MAYAPLHVHSHYSTLDGLSKVRDIFERAKEIGAPAIAITDHASISALPELMKMSEEYGIKAIPGCEFYVVDSAEGENGETRIHISVWAKNWNGVQSILKQLSIANSQFYNRPRITWKQALEFEDCCIGTACTVGPLFLDDYKQKFVELKMAYGDDLYLEVMPHEIVEGGRDIQALVNSRAIELSCLYGTKLIATNDSHYTRLDDAHTHEILLAIQSGRTWKDPDRWKFNGEFDIKSREDLEAAFARLGYMVPCAHGAINNTLELASKVDVKMPKFEVHLPSLYSDDDKVFQDKIMLGWNTIVLTSIADKDVRHEYMKRLVYEVDVIKRLGFIKYFLIVEDIISWARSQGIMVGPGRGSAGGSLVCYLMGITQVDPMKFGLYFERFLNPERIDLPDIDVDFADDRRDEVFDYIRSKYGLDKTAKISTFTAMTDKVAFKDVARVFDINFITATMLAKQIEDSDSFDKVPDLVKFKKEHPEIVEQAKKLSGTIRSRGIHAAGIIVSSEPLVEVAAIESRSGVDAVNWDKNDAERFGLLKIDILGLSTLSILDHAKRIIKERRGVDIDFTKIPLDDEKTLESFSQGNGVGVFQFENSGMQSLLRDLKANTFDMITDTTALFRPGSLNSGQTSQYVKIHNGDEYEHYECQQLKDILGSTKGILVYQEQIMRIFNELGGFTWAQADKMRKIIGKKLGKDEFEKHRQTFVDGCLKNGVDSTISSTLFDKMAEFAAYSFNKSHAVEYTMLSFWSMYLKVHYPVEFFTAQLSNSSDDRMKLIAAEAERLGLKIMLPHINLSERHFTIDSNGNIVPPLGMIKGVGAKAVEEILYQRQEHPLGAFQDLGDFNNRVSRRVVNSRVVDTLTRAGAFSSFGVCESDHETHTKNLSELLPTFNSTPRLALGGGNMDAEELKKLLVECVLCAKSSGRGFMMPKFASSAIRPSIMVINNPVKKEAEHLTSDGTKILMTTLKPYGVKAKDIYYTSPTKCFLNGKSVTKECEGKCLDFLRREIKAVGPKLIICFIGDLATMLIGEKKPSMAKLHNTLHYSKQLGCYVLFSRSPQYCYYNDEHMPKFLESMETVGRMFA